MNKKLLFGLMSLAALTACTNDDFESKQVAQEASPIQFEVLNNDATTRASMNGNKIVWNANDGDIFSLYHGGAGITGYENAIYTANANEGGTATLTTPSMIKAGLAVMVWPVDTTFRIGPADNLSIEIPANQKADIENYIPYMSDQITIGAYGTGYDGTHGTPAEPNAYNTAGKDRKYPVFMRPMASQLIVKADYNGTDAKIATLYGGDDPIDSIKVESVELLTGTDVFTTNLDVKWTVPTPAINTQWASVAHNAWTAVTDFDLGAINATTARLTTECLTGNASSKFLILPQPAIAGGVDEGAVVVNTIYGKVLIGDPGIYDGTGGHGVSYYTAAEYNNAWYRYLSSRKVAADTEENASATTKTTSEDPDANGKYKTVAKALNLGMQQTINGLSTYTHQSTSVVKGEPEGAATTRYVVVNLECLDMSDLHIKSDKQLRDAARVWKKMNLAPVTVYLDGDALGNFEISQKTIEVINTVNGAGLNFKVQPCQLPGESCDNIVITGGGQVPHIAFIAYNDIDDDGIFTPGTDFAADVTLNGGETWNWVGSVKVTATGVNQIINEGTMVNAVGNTLCTYEHGFITQNNVPFVNDGTWNITGGTLNVEFNVTNNGTVNIAKGAQYRQDGQHQNTVFINDALALPTRFGGFDEFIGTVVNEGVFATVEKAGTYTAKIHNYGLIEHADVNAKTYVTTNQTTGADFTAAADFTTPGNAGNKIGRINLPYSNKDEDNVSISAALTDGFVSVTVDGEVTGALNATVVGPRVNYVIVKSGVTSISNLPTPQVKYLEINMTDKSEIAWSVTGTKTFDGLMVLSDVNIKLGTKVISGVTYLGSDMYVGGKFNQAAIPAEGTDPAFAATNWNGYYGNTSSNVSSKYITY